MKTVQPNTEITQASKEDKSYWERHIKAQQTSGISRAEYCRINQVNYDRFGYWIRILKNCQKSSTIIPIRIKPEVSQMVPTDENKALCKIVFRNGMSLYIHDQKILLLILERMM